MYATLSGWRDILVQSKEVRGVVFSLDGDGVGSDAIADDIGLTIGTCQEVQIEAAIGV
jgi:hypothetical protein